MKRALYYIPLFLSLCIVVAPDLFAQREMYVLDIEAIAQDERINDIYLSAPMLRTSSLNFKDSKIPSFEGIIKSTESIRILSSDTPGGVKLIQTTFAPICNYKNKAYETLFSVKSEGAVVRLIGKAQHELMDELYLIVDDNQETVAIIFGGNYSRKQIKNTISEAMPRKNSSSREGRKHKK